jgi:hypothetical protein
MRPCSVTARNSIPQARTERVVVGIHSERRTYREQLGIEAWLVEKNSGRVTQTGLLKAVAFSTFQKNRQSRFDIFSADL